MNETHVQRNYKDTMFRMLFKEKENLLSLYNAVNKTSYTDVGDLEITTLENAVYMNYKNDISFVFDFELMLYEHQSAVNPNMPLRNLIYVTKVLQNITRNETLYSTVIIRLPAPRFVVFYNGTDSQPGRQILRLSDAFEKKMEKPELELTVSVYNINPGYNAELMEACHLLKEYAQYVEQVRKFSRKTFFPEAVEQAVDYCIRNGILADFLSKNRAEAIAVSIFEYDEEKHLKSERELAYKNGEDAGIEKGIVLGREEGEKRFSELLQILMKAERNDDLSRAISDQHYREQLYLENNL
ncbi:MAG: hypothetical protein HDR24_00200 [Lachnospiraceae bacterium]|nr:hypothetical protein [Lachnospiraceae bacterium]